MKSPSESDSASDLGKVRICSCGRYHSPEHDCFDVDLSALRVTEGDAVVWVCRTGRRSADLWSIFTDDGEVYSLLRERFVPLPQAPSLRAPRGWKAWHFQMPRIIALAIAGEILAK